MPDPKGGHYVIHIEDIVRDNGRTGLAIYREILQETDHETPASRVASLLKGFLASNPNIIGMVMVDAINLNREGKQ